MSGHSECTTNITQYCLATFSGHRRVNLFPHQVFFMRKVTRHIVVFKSRPVKGWMDILIGVNKPLEKLGSIAMYARSAVVTRYGSTESFLDNQNGGFLLYLRLVE